jgi:uncharacterized membrane protein YjgN (DUF898 family)
MEAMSLTTTAANFFPNDGLTLFSYCALTIKYSTDGWKVGKTNAVWNVLQMGRHHLRAIFKIWKLVWLYHTSCVLHFKA